MGFYGLRTSAIGTYIWLFDDFTSFKGLIMHYRYFSYLTVSSKFCSIFVNHGFLKFFQYMLTEHMNTFLTESVVTNAF